MKFYLTLLLLAVSLFACTPSEQNSLTYRSQDKFAWENQVRKQSREITSHPNWAEPYQLRGFAYYQLAKYGLALQDFHSALEQDPNYLLAAFNRGMTYLQLGQKDSALKDFEYILLRDNRHARSYFQIGYLNYLKGNFEMALDYFYKAIEVNPEYKSARHFRAACFFYMDKKEDAIRDYTYILYAHPEDEIALINRGLSQISMGEWENALTDIEKAIEIDSASSQAWYFKGLALLTGKKHDSAIDALSKAIRIDPSNAYFYLYRGFAKQKMGNNAASRADYDQALLKNPAIKLIPDEDLPDTRNHIKLVEP
ncbi:MAG: tetratricopeptide repeat protein [Bacteroidia bacterium]|nr:tetratricopeptide repeat protein [Bacteroidia bacterium]